MTNQDVVSELVEKFGWSAESAKLGIQANFRCEYCGRDLLASVNDYDAWQVDHVLPKSKGGEDKIENLALSCKTCNFMKRNNVPEGNDRKDRIKYAAAEIKKLRAKKLSEVAAIRQLVSNIENE